MRKCRNPQPGFDDNLPVCHETANSTLMTVAIAFPATGGLWAFRQVKIQHAKKMEEEG